MSDTPPPVFTQADIDAAAAHDARVRSVVAAERLHGRLTDEQGDLFALMATLRESAEEAMKTFAYADLSDTRLLQDLQARVFRFRVAYDTFATTIEAGNRARMSIMDEAGL